MLCVCSVDTLTQTYQIVGKVMSFQTIPATATLSSSISNVIYFIACAVRFQFSDISWRTIFQISISHFMILLYKFMLLPKLPFTLLTKLRLRQVPFKSV